MGVETAQAATLQRPALAAAAAASIGAGFVHAAVVGSHTDHEQLAVLFVATAIFQAGWGLVALWRPSRLLAAVGAIGNAAVFGAWLTSRITGISFIDGLEEKEMVGFTDAVCAGLGFAAALFSVAALRRAAHTPVEGTVARPPALLASALRYRRSSSVPPIRTRIRTVPPGTTTATRRPEGTTTARRGRARGPEAAD